MEKTIYSETYTALCRILRDAREFKDMTQVELARKLGRPQSFVAKVEAGERRVDVVEFLAIAKALHVSPERLLERLSEKMDGVKARRR